MTVCPGCGKPVSGFIASLVHCDPSEPIDDIDDGDTVVRSTD